MKIRIIKEIPGYKKGDVFVMDNMGMPVQGSKTDSYEIYGLIDDGFAEEIKDVDIEKIRREEGVVESRNNNTYYVSEQESIFLQAFRVVSRVIKELNGDWEADWEDNTKTKYFIEYNHASKKFWTNDAYKYQASLLPEISTEDIVDKVIELVEPELKTLFHIK